MSARISADFVYVKGSIGGQGIDMHVRIGQATSYGPNLAVASIKLRDVIPVPPPGEMCSREETRSLHLKLLVSEDGSDIQSVEAVEIVNEVGYPCFFGDGKTYEIIYK